MLKLQNNFLFKLISNSKQKITGSRHKIYISEINNEKICIRKLCLKKNDINYFNRNFSIKNEFFFLKLLEKNKINVSKAIAIYDDYLITEFIEGEILSEKIIKNEYKKNLIIYKKLLSLIIKVHSINIEKFLTKRYKKEYKNNFFNYLYQNINSTIFKKYFNNHDSLKEYINFKFQNIEFLYYVPVIYDLHAENIIVKKNSDLFLFDLDYCHFAPLELEFISIFLDIFARYNHSNLEYLRKLFIKKYKKENFKFNYELEKLFAINHYVVAIIKHHYKKQYEAKSKIKIYVKELNRLILNNELRYPKISWKVKKLYSKTLSKK